ncbi:MAG: hypothetical protein AAF098_12955 [Pseudomonadota bacterium]
MTSMADNGRLGKKHRSADHRLCGQCHGHKDTSEEQNKPDASKDSTQRGAVNAV